MAADQTRPKILFIDDDEDLVFALSRILESEGYTVRHAVDGEIGICMALDDPPDLILLDLVMPVKNGFEVAAAMRCSEQLRDVPILAMTAFGQNIGEIYGAGRSSDSPSVQDYIEKPVEPNVFLERIAATLAQRGANPTPTA